MSANQSSVVSTLPTCRGRAHMIMAMHIHNQSACWSCILVLYITCRTCILHCKLVMDMHIELSVGI